MLIRSISVRSHIPSVPKEYKMGTKGRGIEIPPSCPGVLPWEQTGMDGNRRKDFAVADVR